MKEKVGKKQPVWITLDITVHICDSLWKAVIRLGTFLMAQAMHEKQYGGIFLLPIHWHFAPAAQDLHTFFWFCFFQKMQVWILNSEEL